MPHDISSSPAPIKTETTIQELAWHKPDEARNWRVLVRIDVVRPGRILHTEPLGIVIELVSASSWGMIYLFATSLTVKTQPLGSPSSLPAQDIGLSWLSWTTALAVGSNWAIPMASLVVMGFAVKETAHMLSGYLADPYLLSLASAFSGLVLMPLVAHNMYAGLKASIAGPVLAALPGPAAVLPVHSFFRRQMRNPSHKKLQRNYDSEPRADPERRRGTLLVLRI
ncbi:hypothetical protein LX36DRAFT_706098 [Colletotrichum falcatum]|nr:hypothetical protein LX36DRAFT_706098 [Colletotrichum falcatum]